MKAASFIYSLVISLSISAQTSTDYLDQYLDETSKKSAVYSRVLTENSDGVFTAEIFLLTGVKKATGGYLMQDGDLIPHGYFVFYYANGQKESEGLYDAGYKTGEWRRFMIDGKEIMPRYYQPSLGNKLKDFRKP